PAGELRDPRRLSTVPRPDAHRLRDESAEPLEIDDARELTAVGGRAGGEHDRVLEVESCRGYGERRVLRRECRIRCGHCRGTADGAGAAVVATLGFCRCSSIRRRAVSVSAMALLPSVHACWSS